jgi:hypothetical protein
MDAGVRAGAALVAHGDTGAAASGVLHAEPDEAAAEVLVEVGRGGVAAELTGARVLRVDEADADEHPARATAASRVGAVAGPAGDAAAGLAEPVMVGARRGGAGRAGGAVGVAAAVLVAGTHAVPQAFSIGAAGGTGAGEAPAGWPGRGAGQAPRGAWQAPAP